MASSKNRHRFHETAFIDEGMDDVGMIHRWALELLIQHGGLNQFVGRMGYNDDDFAQFLGLELLDDGENSDSKSLERIARQATKERYVQIMSLDTAARGMPVEIEKNTLRLGELIGANAVEIKLLQFAVLMHAHGGLNRAADFIGELTTHRLIRVLAALLKEPATAIKAALAEGSILSESGILTVDRNGNYNFPGKLELISKSFADRMLETVEADPVTLFRSTLNRAESSSLNPEHYAHMRKEFAVLKNVLVDACKHRRKGVNIFLYGEPGTGKTELARLLADLLGVKGFEVSSEDEDGDPIAGEKRLKAWRAANAMLRQRKAVLIFDEVEDVFRDGSLFEPSTAQKRKGWMNRALENNAVPTIWLSNNVSSLDPSFVRRFDVLMEVKQPTRSQRKRMAQDMVGHLASKDLLERIAQSEHMSPAIMQRSGRVVSRLKDQLASTKGKSGKKGDALQSDDLESTLEMLLHNTLQAQGYRGLADNESDQASGLYDPAFTHADTDLARLAAGIRARPHARICLYGPPGTGKTAYGRWLAEQLDKPLHVKRASDLLGMYVGETEKRMALAFNDADEEGAVLLIDEVDSFLQDRSKAQRNWEISMVNEMLTQMERFKGVFIASTNLMDGLDQASLRRFDLKLKFDYLRPAQSRELFQRWCQKLGLKDVAHEANKMVESLEVLTPGDFAALGRRHHFAPFESPSEVAAALVDGCNLKQIPLNRKVGFIH